MAAVLVAVFVALYPALDLAGHCDQGGCPDVIQISASSSPDLPATGVLAAAVAPVSGTALSLGLLPALQERPPDEILLSPEPPPPRT
ncbi:hypothetical protein [Rubrobacter aplysinae]|uniref:hypothetical protein n=1 Tax=Rubrobacter aplysinae TaxID=909625 RepID=UPI00064BDC74|nr:hypothetical protein [Rubrobacter aplysinae]